MSGLPPPSCELDQWALAEVEKRQRSGEVVHALLIGVGAEAQARRMAALGARVVLLSDLEEEAQVNVLRRPAALFDALAESDEALPLQPFDIVLCQRALSALPYAEARRRVRRLLGRLKIGGKLFVSLYGIHSDLGDHYTDGGKLVCDRFAVVAPDLAQRYGIDGPVCLYSERNLFMLLMECGGAVLKTSSSALGHVRGIAARI
jgi:hypothetical protein